MKMKRYLIFLFMLFAEMVFSVFFHPALAEQFPAVVEAKESAVLAAEREGTLTRLAVDVGDRVEKGTVLGMVFHQDLILTKEKAEATDKYLKILVENLRRLNSRGLVTDEELAKAEMDLVVNEKEIELVETDIRRSRLVAPFPGRVVKRHTQPHEWVQVGQPVIELYNPKELQIVTDLPTDLAFQQEAGDVLLMQFPDLNQQIEARLKIFSPKVDVRSNTIKVFWEIDSREGREIGLKPGMKGFLELVNE